MFEYTRVLDEIYKIRRISFRSAGKVKVPGIRL